jgi:magnesium transporter
MLTCFTSGTAPVPGTDAKLPATSDWFDLVDPSKDDIERVERATGLHLPDRANLSGIELSNRIDVEDGAVRLTIPYFSPDDDTPPSPVGILLTPDRLVSLRYADSPAFDLAARRLSAAHSGNSIDAFMLLVQAIVATTADRMEAVASEVSPLAARIFSKERHRTRLLHASLTEIGSIEGRLTRLRLSATGLLRLVISLRENAPEWLGKPYLARLHAAQKDLDVLCEFDSQLTDKLQFLLDAVLGYINIDQNDVIKILTVASVVSIPPVILAGIWGMNFDHMPELHEPHAYPLALLAIILSIVLPLVWFKRRGWM